jgi:hypothetical protein
MTPSPWRHTVGWVEVRETHHSRLGFPFHFSFCLLSSILGRCTISTFLSDVLLQHPVISANIGIYEGLEAIRAI